jgi:hypothetical protein
MATTVRYVPERELPAYTYVPGRAPHPINDPRGHSYRAQPPTSEQNAAPSGGVEFCRSGDFLWGIDLFNHGYYWEAHEAWEGVWIAAGRQGPLAEFVQGLIKLAAAGVKAREGRPDGVRRHTARARELIDSAFGGIASVDAAALGLSQNAVLSICDDMDAAAAASFPEDSVPRLVVNHSLELVQ